MIEDNDLKKALLLVRELRRQALIQNVDPVAMRIALKFALKVDDLCAQQRLTEAEEKAIEIYVDKLVKAVAKA